MEGEHFLAGNPQVTVRFGNLSVSVVPESGRRFTVTVPSGAATGPVTVTTTASVEGRTIEQTSNPANVLVIWNEIDAAPLHPGPGPVWIIDTLPGGADDFFVFAKGYRMGWLYEVLYQVRHDGTIRPVRSNAVPSAGRPYTSWYQVARNPVNGHLIARRYVSWEEGHPPQIRGWIDLVDLDSGAVIYRGYDERAPYDSTWRISSVSFDGEGNLFLLAWQRIDSSWPYLWNLGLWRFAPGEDVVLEDARALWVQGWVPAYNLGVDLAVGADGTAWVVVQWLAAVDRWAAEIHRFEPGGGHTVFAAPPGFYDVDTYSGIYVAADCTGRAFIHNPCQWDSGCQNPFAVYVYPPGEPVAHMNGLYHAFDAEVDGYGNLFFLGATDSRSVVRRLRPQEMADPHFYDTFDCCAVETHKALLEGQAKPPGVRIPPDVCDLGGTLRIRLVLEPEDPISGWEGNPDAYTWIEGDGQGKAEARILFGQAPKLQAFWKPAGGGEETAETVKWEVVAGSETAPNADAGGLYPGKPAVFFTGGVNPYQNAEVRFQTVHTGSFVLKATATDSNHRGPDGRPAAIEVTFTVAAPAGLGDMGAPHHEYDALIVRYADKYGIPPQYLKSQVYEESGHDYSANAFRYEPLGFDKKYLSTWSTQDWARNNYDFFKFPEGPGLTEADRAQRERYSHIIGFDYTASPPTLPYTCAPFERTAPSVALMDVVAANDGWFPGSYPWAMYNHAIGPCGVRLNWSRNAGARLAYHAGRFYCGRQTDSPCTPPQENLGQWLLDHPDYEAQTAVASSYGLLQLMYPTAVGTMGWHRGQPAQNRDPVLLFDPATSLDLGAGYDAYNIFKWAFFRDPHHEWPSLFDFQQALVKGFYYYNRYKEEYQIGLHIAQGYIFSPF